MASVTAAALAEGLFDHLYPGAGETYANTFQKRKDALEHRAERLIELIEAAGHEVTEPAA